MENGVSGTVRGVERRAFIKGAAWLVPVITTAAVVPLSSASTAGMTLSVTAGGCNFVAAPSRGTETPGFRYTVADGTAPANTELRLDLTASGIAAVTADTFRLRASSGNTEGSLALVFAGGRQATVRLLRDFAQGEWIEVGFAGVRDGAAGRAVTLVNDRATGFAAGVAGAGTSGAALCIADEVVRVDPMHLSPADVQITGASRRFRVAVDGSGAIPAGTSFLLFRTAGTDTDLGTWNWSANGAITRAELTDLPGVSGIAKVVRLPFPIEPGTAVQLVADQGGADVSLAFIGTDRDPANNSSGTTTAPPFPADITRTRRSFRNWDGVITTDPLWTAVPASADDVVRIVNWAAAAGHTVRPTGFRHTWSPLTVLSRTPGDAPTILVDTTAHLTAKSIPVLGRVKVGAGARMDDLLDYLHRNGQALASASAPGDVTVGGVLAINGHGTAIRAKGEQRVPGQAIGTMSNLVTAFTAVVWDDAAGAYVAKEFDRSLPDAKAFLTGIGRVFLLDVTLQTMPAYSLRSESVTDIHVKDLFAAPAAAGANSLSALLDKHGHVGLIWYTFTDYPWIQKWTVTDDAPFWSRRTSGPYNYLFADNMPNVLSDLIGQLVSGQAWVAPTFGQAVYAATRLGLATTGSRDMWGPAKDIIHFVKPTTLKVSAGSHAMVTRRTDVQRVVHEFSTWFTTALASYRARGQYPVNSCVEIRVTGVDDPSEVDVPGAEAPSLSAARLVDGRPEYDTVVWLDALTLPGTAHEHAFFAEMEAFIRTNYADYAVARPEWAKRWASTDAGPWTDAQVMSEDIPAAFPEWEWTRSTFDRYDPARLFSNPLLDRLMPRR